MSTETPLLGPRVYEIVIARRLSLNTGQALMGSVSASVSPAGEQVEWRCRVNVPVGSLHKAFREAARRSGTTGGPVPSATALEVLTENHQLDTRHAVPASLQGRGEHDHESIEWTCRAHVPAGFLAEVEAEAAAFVRATPQTDTL